MSSTARHLGLLTLIVLLVVTLAFGVRTADDRTDTESAVLEGGTFGTFYRIDLRGPRTEAEIDRLRQGVEDMLEEVDAAMSTYRDDSELNRLSATPPGEWLEVSAGLWRVLSISQDVAAATNGGLDVTVGGLVRRWGFGPDQRPERIPSTTELREAVAVAGYQGLELDADRQAARRTADYELDVSATAKGHAIDAIARLLEREGIEHYLVNIGGDMRAGGRYSAERPWRVGIQRPDDEGQAPVDVIALENMAVATSGDYRNYYEEGGRRYSHIIDPRTGRPIEHGLASVTVLHPNAARADAYATGLMVAGPDAAMEVATAQDLKVLLIVRDDDGFTTRRSPGLTHYLDARDSGAED